MKHARPSSADKHVSKQHCMCFEAREDSIFVKSKMAVRPQAQWSPWFKMLPHPKTPKNVSLHPANKAPATRPAQEWRKYKQVVESLKKFYRRTFKNPVNIPDADFLEMKKFLKDGPSPHIAPDWIDWQVPPPTIPAVPTTSVTTTSADRSADEVEQARKFKRGKVWRAFLAPRGTEQNQETGSKPTRKRTRRSITNDSDRSSTDDDLSVGMFDKVFPFEVGTKVVREFNTGIFEGVVARVDNAKDNCLIVWEDGDQEHMDRDETLYATQLYKREYPPL